MADTDPAATPADGAPSATRHDLQLGRRFFHLLNGVSIATAYAFLFTHEQVVHIFGAIACLIYILDRIRIAYPEVLARHAPWMNHTFLRAEERVREAAMTPFAIAVLLTILTVPKPAALVAIYSLGIADPLAAIVGIRFGRHRLSRNRSLEGSLAYFAATAAIAAVVLEGMAGAPRETTMVAAAAVALSATAFDLLPLRIDDNLTIPLFVGFATWGTAAVLGLPLG